MEDNCRVCLCGDRHMHAINNTVFQEIWERLTKAKFNINDGKPLFVCYICYAQLRNAHQLMKRALKSEELLTTIKNIGSEQEQRTKLLIASLGEDFAYKYTIAEAFQLECNEVQSNSAEEIKRENEEGGEENIEEENEIVIKEEDDKWEEETQNIPDYESGTHSDETLLKNTLEREVRIVLEKIEMGAHVRKRTLKVPRNIKRIKINQRTRDRNSTSDTSCCKQLTVDLNLVIPKIEQINSEVGPTNAGNEICLAKNAGTVPPSSLLEGREEENCLNISKHKLSHVTYQHKCATKSGLNRHLRQHTGEKPYKCDLCECRFSRKSSLINHIKSIHTKEKNYSCHICLYKCVTKRNLNIHLRQHTGEKPYKCDLCECRFSRKSSLINHIKSIHTKEKNYSCHICLYKCIAKSDLNIHLRKHTGEKPYKCDLCEFRFSRKSSLINHIKSIHTKEKNYSCHICLYKCVTKDALNKHLRKHTGEKPYKCDLCDYTCSQRGSLMSHTKYIHTKEKNHSCHTCLYKCVTKRDLNSHLRKHYEENV